MRFGFQRALHARAVNEDRRFLVGSIANGGFAHAPLTLGVSEKPLQELVHECYLDRKIEAHPSDKAANIRFYG